MERSNDPSSLYQSLFEASIDGIVIINDRGIIQDVNNAVIQLMGYSSEEMVGQNVRMLMGAPHREKHDGYIENYKKTREAKIIGIGREVEAVRKDGSVFPMRLAVSEFSAEGKTYFTGIIHDLSEEHKIKNQLNDYASKLENKVKKRTERLENEILLREKIQKDLVESQKLHEAIAMNFPNGTIGVLDKDLNILFMEGTELQSMGYGSSRLLGENYISLLPDEVQDEVRDNLKQVLKGEHKEFEINTGNKIYQGRSVPLLNDDGSIDKILQVDINITKEKKAEEEIYNALMKEKQLNEMKSNFVSMASHEFRTPLSSIQSSASLIKKYKEVNQQDNRERHIAKISSNVQNLNLILNDFLSLEKIEGGLIKNKPQAFVLTDFLNEIIEETGPLMKKNQIIETKFIHTVDKVNLDPFLLRNILNNLLSNAYKYSNEGEKIRIESDDVDGLGIRVIDSGIGISKEDQIQLFSRFYRASNATNIQGTGLGLNIVKRYVQLMEGEITFESELNRGSTFTLKFRNYE